MSSTVLDEVLGDGVKHDDYRQLVNPTGSFVLGGPAPTRPDRPQDHRRHVRRRRPPWRRRVQRQGPVQGRPFRRVRDPLGGEELVAAGLAHRVELQVAYAIGVAEPVSVNVETFGTEIGVTREQIQQAVRKVFDLRPAAIIDELDLKRPIYAKTAAYGHFGRVDVEFPWERTDKVEELKAAIR